MDEELTGPLMLDLVKRLAYPEKYAADYNHWFRGDGPAEVYFCELSDKAKTFLEELRKEPAREGHN